MAMILYIAGYGRSGSTVLDIILGNHPEIAGVGEVSYLLRDWTERLCSCGVPYGECEFWKDLFINQPPTPELDQLMRKVERVSFIPWLLMGLVSNEDRQTYRAYQTRLFEYVLAKERKRIVVDSSKSTRPFTGRFLALSMLAEQDVYVLHLVRNGLATLVSDLVTGDNWALEEYASPPKLQALRTTLGWVGTQVLVPLLGRLLGSSRYMMLRYEDIITDPATALRAIGQFCGFDEGPLIDRINHDDYFQVGHNVGGNRVRLQGEIKLWRRINKDYSNRLKPHHRLLFICLGGWLQRYYGYDLE